jgi:hypothetical protein
LARDLHAVREVLIAAVAELSELVVETRGHGRIREAESLQLELRRLSRRLNKIMGLTDV